MRKLIITSEHRVGSRWLHYLLAEFLGFGTSPEIDASKLIIERDTAIARLEANQIVKYHHATQDSISKVLRMDDEIMILGVVRNPRDRGVSKAFHDFYHPKHDYAVKRHATTDFDAVKWIVTQDEGFKKDNYRQVQILMMEEFSTRTGFPRGVKYPYIWTSYEWLLDDIEGELVAILEAMEFPLNKPARERLRNVIRKHDFKNKSGREAGNEVRKNTWRRKGTQLDWINWYDAQMLSATEYIDAVYWTKLITSGRHGHGSD